MNWESVLGVITHPVVVTVVSGVAGVAITGFVKYKKAFKKLVDVPRTVLLARKPGSPGGKRITDAEYTAIGKKIVELAEAAAPLVGRKGK